MTRMLTPWFTRAARLPEFEMDLPKWMTEVFGPEAGMMGREGKFLPEANMIETDKSLEVTVELPGMKPEDVKGEIKENGLWITGEKKEEKEEKGKTYHRVERRSGSFSRSLTLPCHVNEHKVVADYKEGVLTIHLPKVEGAKTHKIKVQG